MMRKGALARHSHEGLASPALTNEITLAVTDPMREEGHLLFLHPHPKPLDQARVVEAAGDPKKGQASVFILASFQVAAAAVSGPPPPLSLLSPVGLCARNSMSCRRSGCDRRETFVARG